MSFLTAPHRFPQLLMIHLDNVGVFTYKIKNWAISIRQSNFSWETANLKQWGFNF